MKHELKVYLSRAINGNTYTSTMHYIKVNGKTKQEAIDRVLSKDLRKMLN